MEYLKYTGSQGAAPYWSSVWHFLRDFPLDEVVQGLLCDPSSVGTPFSGWSCSQKSGRLSVVADTGSPNCSLIGKGKKENDDMAPKGDSYFGHFIDFGHFPIEVGKKVPTWEGKVLERKQKRFWNLWRNCNTLGACKLVILQICSLRITPSWRPPNLRLVSETLDPSKKFWAWVKIPTDLSLESISCEWHPILDPSNERLVDVGCLYYKTYTVLLLMNEKNAKKGYFYEMKHFMFPSQVSNDFTDMVNKLQLPPVLEGIGFSLPWLLSSAVRLCWRDTPPLLQHRCCLHPCTAHLSSNP